MEGTPQSLDHLVLILSSLPPREMREKGPGIISDYLNNKFATPMILADDELAEELRILLARCQKRASEGAVTTEIGGKILEVLDKGPMKFETLRRCLERTEILHGRSRLRFELDLLVASRRVTFQRTSRSLIYQRI